MILSTGPAAWTGPAPLVVAVVAWLAYAAAALPPPARPAAWAAPALLLGWGLHLILLLLDIGGMDTYSSGQQNNSRRVTDMPSDDPAQAFVHGMAIDLEMGGDK